jgi:hypothetical protein
MRITSSPINRMALAVMLGLARGICGCQKLKRIFVKPAREGIAQQSYTIRMHGYEQMVTVKAPPWAVADFLTDLNNIVLPGYQSKEVAAIIAEGKKLEPGSSFPASFSRMGIKFAGRMIVIKMDPESMWWVFDSPQFYSIQRWEFQPVREGTRLTLKVDYEIPASLETPVQSTGLLEVVLKDLDLMMANIQASFDPSLEAEKLVAVGLRGHDYQTIFQAYESSVWINSSPEQTVRIALEHDNLIGVYTAMQIEGGECIFEPENKKKWDTNRGEPVFCPCIFEVGGFKWKMDNFTTIKPNDPGNVFTVYGVGLGVVVQIKLAVQPELGGARVRMNLIVEPPGSASANMMDALIITSGLPDWMGKTLQQIKARVEEKNERAA